MDYTICYMIVREWLVILLAVGAMLVMAILRTARESRRRAAETHLRICGVCDLNHPGFALYCRHCGRKLPET